MAITREWDDSGLLIHYISDKTNVRLRYDGMGFMVFDENKFIGGIAGTEFKVTRATHQCEIAWAAETPRWFTMANMRAFYDKAFNELGLTRLNGSISVNNERSIKAATRYGFRIEGVMRNAGEDGEDRVILGMTRNDDCKSLRHRDDNPPTMADKSAGKASAAQEDKDSSNG